MFTDKFRNMVNSCERGSENTRISTSSRPGGKPSQPAGRAEIMVDGLPRVIRFTFFRFKVLQVFPAETRLTVYRRLEVTRRAE